jgi:hypothetical protein
MSYGSTRTVSRVRFFTRYGSEQLVIDFKDGRSLRLHRGQIAEILDGVELSIEESYDILYLASLKTESYTVPDDVAMAGAIIEELRGYLSGVLYQQKLQNVQFYTRSRYHDMYLTMSGGGKIRLRKGQMLEVLKRCILSGEQLEAVLDMGYHRVRSYRNEEDYDAAMLLFSEYHIAYDQLKAA